MFISASRARVQSADRLLGYTLPVSEWAAGRGGRVLGSLQGVAQRHMGQRLDDLKPLQNPTPARYLLRPKQVIWRARMVRLSVAWKNINAYANAARAWELVQRFFPETLEKYHPSNLALDTLPALLHRVEEAGWFEVDWETMDYFWEVLANEDEDGLEPYDLDFGMECEIDLLACLEYIPVKRYNWSVEQWMNMDGMPLLSIFKRFLDHDYHMTTGYDTADYHRLTPEWLKERCQAVAESRGEPFDILPTLVDYVLAKTGNPLLDGHSDSSEMRWPYDLGYKWDRPEDVEELKRLSAEATLVWQQIKTLAGWLDTDDTIEDFLDELLFGGDEDEETEDDDYNG
jgi:hypothetical protein